MLQKTTGQLKVVLECKSNLLYNEYTYNLLSIPNSLKIDLHALYIPEFTTAYPIWLLHLLFISQTYIFELEMLNALEKMSTLKYLIGYLNYYIPSVQ